MIECARRVSLINKLIDESARIKSENIFDVEIPKLIIWRENTFPTYNSHDIKLSVAKYAII